MEIRFKFGKEALKAMTPPPAGKRLTVYDTVVPKLALRMTGAGTKTFYIVKRSGSSIAWVRIGTFPDVTVEQARKEAEKALGEFASGSNPAAARRAIRGEPTFSEAFDSFLDGKQKRDGSALADKTRRGYQDVMRLYLGPIQNKKLSQVTRDDVKSISLRRPRKASRRPVRL